MTSASINSGLYYDMEDSVCQWIDIMWFLSRQRLLKNTLRHTLQSKFQTFQWTGSLNIYS